MRTRFWRHVCVLALGVLLVAPIVVAEETIPLAWYAPEDGIRRGPADEGKTVLTANEVTFTKPIACKGALKCFIDGTEIENCTLSPEEIEYSEDRGKFVTTTDSAFAVSCYKKDSGKKIWTQSELAEEGIECTLEDLSQIQNEWPPFLPWEEGKKAEPWSKENKSYCPDPILHSKAYDLLVDDKGNVPEYAQVSAELVRRSTLEACFRVVDAYKTACVDKLGDKNDKVLTTIKEKRISIEKDKMKLIAKKVMDPKCESIDNWWKKSSGSCIKEWKLIKGKKAESLAVVKNKDSGLWELKKKIEGLTGSLVKLVQFMVNNNKITGNEKWISGTLDEFFEKKAEAEWDNPVYAGELSNERVIVGTTQQIIDFLQKRSISIQMTNALNATKTFQVTKWLRRNNTSEENKLTLIGNKSEDTNILDKVIKLAAQILGSLGVLLLIISAVMMVVSQGEETMLQKAKQTFLYTLIGLIVAFFSYTIVRFILEFLLIR